MKTNTKTVWRLDIDTATRDELEKLLRRKNIMTADERVVGRLQFCALVNLGLAISADQHAETAWVLFFLVMFALAVIAVVIGDVLIDEES